MFEQPLFGQLLELCSRASVIAIRIDAYTSTWREDTRYLNIFRVHQADQVFHDDVDAILVESPMVNGYGS